VVEAEQAGPVTNGSCRQSGERKGRLSGGPVRLRGKDSNLDYLIQRCLGSPNRPRHTEANPHRYGGFGCMATPMCRRFSVRHVAPLLPLCTRVRREFVEPSEKLLGCRDYRVRIIAGYWLSSMGDTVAELEQLVDPVVQTSVFIPERAAECPNQRAVEERTTGRCERITASTNGSRDGSIFSRITPVIFNSHAIAASNTARVGSFVSRT